MNKLAREIWTWCEERGLWLSAFFIPGIDNLRADSLSRAGKKLNEDMEWGLDQSVFDEIQVRMGRCNIDLFASSQNNKLPLYASYKPDKSAVIFLPARPASQTHDSHKGRMILNHVNPAGRIKNCGEKSAFKNLQLSF